METLLRTVGCVVGTHIALAACQIASAITIDTVPIGNPGNPADTRYPDSLHPNGVGSVPYSFRMGKTEITNAQYVAFLNAVAKSDPYELYAPNVLGTAIFQIGLDGSYTYEIRQPGDANGHTYEDKPVVFVSWGDAARFANWLHNGQPTGSEDATTTEDGAYTLNGATTNSALGNVNRNPGARWWLPSEDEWYKAAYHKNDGVTANYWDFPTRSNTQPNNNPPSLDSGNSANYYQSNCATGDCFYPLTDAGAYKLSGSPYGTFDQAGNVAEWDEGLEVYSFGSDFYARRLRGGSWDKKFFVSANDPYSADPTDESQYWGFRVATVAVPEPTSIYLVLLISAVLFLFREMRMNRS